MAFITDVAMGHTNFFARMTDFIQNDPDLTALGQNWTLVWSNNPNDPNQLVFSAPGLAGQEQIFIGFNLRFDIAQGVYNVFMRGFSDIIPSVEDWAQHINPSPEVRFFVDPSPFRFWLVGNGRRLLVVNRISTVFQSAYAGLILPYAQPPSYPYPLFIAGTAGDRSSDAETWRSTSEDHNDYLHSFHSTAQTNLTSSNAFLIDPNAAWRPLAGQLSGASRDTTFASVMAHPYESGSEFTGLPVPNSFEALTEQIETYGGDFASQPVTLFTEQPTNQVLGVLDGVLAVQGVNNAAENIITISEGEGAALAQVDHLVVQNTFRTEGHDYHAIRLA